MGVPTFYRWLSQRYPKIIKDLVEECFDGDGLETDFSNPSPSGVTFDCLYLDMNGIIHPCCHPENDVQPATEDEMIANVFQYLDRLMNIVRPQNLLYMAVDGVAPRAKMNQQRMRRFKVALEVAEEEEMYEKLKGQFENEGRTIPPMKTRWDSNVITPGTPFMQNLSEALRNYTKERISKHPLWKGLTIVYSDEKCPGEGEHKIMNFIRSQRQLPHYNHNLTHCLYGADADLIMLGLATHEAHFYIIREAVIDAEPKCFVCGRVGHQAVNCDGNDSKNGRPKQQSLGSRPSWYQKMQILQIPVLREYLSHEFSFQGQKLPFNYDLERCLDDFIFMCFFVGNDFLPHLPSMSIHKGSIDQMLVLYQTVLPDLGGYLTDAGKLNLRRTAKFISFLQKIEDQILQQDYEKERRRKLKHFQSDSESSSSYRKRPHNNSAYNPIPPDIANSHNVRRQLITMLSRHQPKESNDPNSQAANELRNTLKTDNITEKAGNKVSEDVDLFRKTLSEMKKSKNEGDSADDIQLGCGDSSFWRERYYRRKFHLTPQDGIDKHAANIARNYTRGLKWVLRYYYQGCCSWSWFYPFHYAPFASDLWKFGLCDEKETPEMEFDLDCPFLPFDQLMSVLPFRSSHCLPKALANLMVSSHSPVLDFYPTKFKEDPNGKRFRWQYVTLLPFIEDTRLVSATQTVDCKLTAEEKERNRKGNDIIFCHPCHHLRSLVISVNQENRPLDIPDNIPFPIGGSLSRCMHPSSQESKNSAIYAIFNPRPPRPHVSALLPNATPPAPTLNQHDVHTLKTDDGGRRFNAGPARRLILGSLGMMGYSVSNRT